MREHLGCQLLQVRGQAGGFRATAGNEGQGDEEDEGTREGKRVPTMAAAVTDSWIHSETDGDWR